jgi:hypothetical protein
MPLIKILFSSISPDSLHKILDQLKVLRLKYAIEDEQGKSSPLASLLETTKIE